MEIVYESDDELHVPFFPIKAEPQLIIPNLHPGSLDWDEDEKPLWLIEEAGVSESSVVKVECNDAVEFPDIKKEPEATTSAGVSVSCVVKVECNDAVEFPEIKKEPEATTSAGVSVSSVVKVECNDAVEFTETEKEPEATTSDADAGRNPELVFNDSVASEYASSANTSDSDELHHVPFFPIKAEPQLIIPNLHPGSLDWDEDEKPLWLIEEAGVSESSVVKVECNDAVEFPDIKKEPEATTSGHNPGVEILRQAVMKEIDFSLNDGATKSTSLNNIAETLTGQPEATKFMCYYCQLQTDSKCSLRKHISSAHFSVYKLKSHFLEKTHRRERRKLKKIPRRDHLNRPKRTRNSERRYKCDVCDKGYTQNCHLIVHKRTHTGEKPYVCQDCGKGFIQKDRLTVHRRSHTGERPYACQECGRSFAMSNTLNMHMRIHTEEKPYVCRECDKGFARSGDLSKHKIIHTGEKPYACQVCGRDFARRSDLTRHKKRMHPGVSQ